MVARLLFALLVFVSCTEAQGEFRFSVCCAKYLIISSDLFIKNSCKVALWAEVHENENLQLTFSTY
jgi:hypothetical protein